MSRLANGPFGPSDNTPTASIGSRSLTPPEAISGAPAVAAASSNSWGSAPPMASAAIQSAPLAPPSAPAVSAAAGPAAQSVAVASAGAVSSATRSAAGSFGPWTTVGGAPVTVGAGESASVIAARYGVPMEALVKANGLASASQVTPGKSLVIPVYNAGARQAANAAPAAAAAVAAPAQGVRNLAATAPAAARAQTARVAEAPKAATAAAARTTADAKANAARTAADAKTAADARTAAAAKAAADAKTAAAAKTAATTAAAKKDVAKANETVKPAEPERQQTAAAAPAAENKPEFRWPARGRIIQGFKSGANDGISIAVPEGTAVKAAEAGTVAYAGNELKGYGNLVLIRHPNGFVSAYAHNGEINVKRGDPVKRGQTIAKSGQSGNVSAPQLHFELRKGSTPVDPTQYLAGL